jgi:hypothetical protein
MRTILSQQAQISFLLAFLLWSCHGKDKTRVHGLLVRRFRTHPRPSQSVSLRQSISNKTVEGKWPDDDPSPLSRRRNRSKASETKDDSTTTNSQEEPSRRRRIRIPTFSWVVPYLNHIKTRSVLIAVHMALHLEIEGPLLSRLPIKVLMFLVRTCIQADVRPKVLRIVALEVDERLRDEMRRYTGNENYEFGDLTKAAIRHYTGEDDYKFGDLTKSTVRNYTGKEGYEFGDMSRTTIQKLIKAKENYEFGDITKAVVGRLTGREEQVTAYKFGDISRAILTKVSGKETYQFGDITRGLLHQARADEGSKKVSSKNYLDDVESQLEILNKMK